MPTSPDVKWWIPATGLLVCLTLVTTGFGWSISQATKTNATKALADAGIHGVTVDNTYRDVVLTGPAELASVSFAAVSLAQLVDHVTYFFEAGPSPEPTPIVTPETSPSPSPSSCGCQTVLPAPQAIHFGVASATLDPSSKSSLDALATIMLADLDVDSSLRLSISAHTDSIGSKADNQTLSEERAAAVRDYLVGRGIPPEALVTVGYGESHPVASNETEAGRAANRRVDIAIIEEG